MLNTPYIRTYCICCTHLMLSSLTVSNGRRELICQMLCFDYFCSDAWDATRWHRHAILSNANADVCLCLFRDVCWRPSSNSTGDLQFCEYLCFCYCFRRKHRGFANAGYCLCARIIYCKLYFLILITNTNLDFQFLEFQL